MLHAGLGYLRIVRTEWGDVIVRTMLARGTFHSVGFFLKGAAFSSGSSLNSPQQNNVTDVITVVQQPHKSNSMPKLKRLGVVSGVWLVC